ncbi:hypothetical protein IGI04_019180 [Brassica rapa subsp. trilocularis]|uniref:Uncharacterized protein n=1 Tax=Brassica rapa subsp. trilocularis TaxID=1813537 RepID=A0ABQ7MF34_BRACM|nr:hypothetical protein IGI04_019180 [Brassica rapa subsp. trilocularis]
MNQERFFGLEERHVDVSLISRFSFQWWCPLGGVASLRQSFEVLHRSNADLEPVSFLAHRVES